ncbi:MAG TPA: glycoside hydrolase family 15 protein [Acidimicrobiales bacterium]|nr:glycoside hydrolase family 15 protein [Acidimicrobiales bacterium]
MALRLEDYAIIGDTQTAAVVGRDGSIDWLCLPRFDSEACFAALVGDEKNGFWRICPAASGAPGEGAPLLSSSRHYRADTLVLETEWELPEGRVRVTDCMPVRVQNPQVVRIVEGLSGAVEMRMDLVVRFGYGAVVPWVRQLDGMFRAIAGPDAINLWTPVHSHGEGMTTVAHFTIRASQQVPFILSWYPSHEQPVHPIDAQYAVDEATRWWTEWASQSSCPGEARWRDPVLRSAITLKALTYAPTGGIVAAATTSLPETLGGERNWDYRFCWLRDATLTLSALNAAGYHEEALAWRDWLLRAVAGDPSQLQIMYGVRGERTLTERELAWLPGYEGSKPVRIGNLAADQFQLDVYGETISALHESRRSGIDPGPAWELEKVLLDFLEDGWRQPDDGIWEVRGPRRHFTHSKVMAWVGMDRAVRDVEEFGFEGPVDVWRRARDAIKAEVLEKGFDAGRNTFTQYYGSKELDASTLMIPLVGFLPPSDARVVGTVDAIQADLARDGFVLRYDAQNAAEVDGLSGREGAFLACSFWLVDNLEMIGRHDEAVTLFERLLGLANDVGLLAEEYDPVADRLVGNFPQAFSHVSLVNSAVNLQRASGWQGADDHSLHTRLQGRRVSIPHRLRHPTMHHHPSSAKRRSI